MRIDKLLCEKSLAASRTEAQKMITEGTVFVNGNKVIKPSENYEDSDLIEVKGYEKEFVSRAGHKLAAAIRHFELDVCSRVALDVGASTGGFTDCMLKLGASRVYAVDSGHGQLAPVLENDDRVISIEGFNARNLSYEDIGEKVSLITMDVSFISQTCIVPALPALCEDGALFVALIKPQFEAGRSFVGRGGIVKDRAGHRAAIERTVTCAAEKGFSLIGVIPSPILGGDGNREFLAAYKYTGGACPLPDFKKLADEVGV